MLESDISRIISKPEVLIRFVRLNAFRIPISEKLKIFEHILDFREIYTHNKRKSGTALMIFFLLFSKGITQIAGLSKSCLVKTQSSILKYFNLGPNGEVDIMLFK